MSVATGAGIVAVVAVIYGLAVAFGPQVYDHADFWKNFTMIGAIVLGLLAIALIILPWLKVY